MTPTVADEVARYLRTGETVPFSAAWPGETLVESACKAHDDLLRGLVAEVMRRATGHTTPRVLQELDIVAFTRGKVEPMVRGLFPSRERDAVLAVLERSVAFLTPGNIEQVLLGCNWTHSAWTLANLYLASLGAELLGEGAPRILGLSEETRCFVSAAYFEEDDPFADFVVHEAAHVFHNCKRGTVGLHETRRREWLLDIDFGKRENFAYACEAYSRIADRARDRGGRMTLAEQYGRSLRQSDDRLDALEVAGIVQEACASPSGWKVILSRCAPVNATSRR